MLRTVTTRVNYSYESIELLLSRDVGAFRLYGGGEDLIRRDPHTLRPGVIHWGVEWERPRRHGFGALAAGTPFAAIDAKCSQQRHWRVGWDARVGYEFASPSSGHRRWSVDLRGYRGPSPYGQFYGTDISAIGAGISFGL